MPLLTSPYLLGVLASMLLPLSSIAQCFTFEDITPSCLPEGGLDAIGTYGTSTYECELNCLIINDQTVDTLGGAIFYDPDIQDDPGILMDLSQGFQFIVDVNFGDDDDGGEGFIFVLAQNKEDVLPCGIGGYIGYEGIPNSIGFEFDTRQQAVAPFNDLVDFDHFNLLNSAIGNILTPPISILHPAENQYENVETGEGHNITVRWDPEEQLIEVFVGEDLRMAYQVDLISYFDQVEVVPGLVTATGGSPNIQQLCGIRFSLVDPRSLESCADVLDLQNWMVTNHPDNARWKLEFTDSCVQTINALPSFFVSPIDFIEAEMEVYIEVKTADFSNYIGVGFGTQSPFAQVYDQCEGWLLDWRGNDESSCNETVLSPEGITLAYLDGTNTYDCNDPTNNHLLTHDSSAVFQVYDVARGAFSGWEPFTRYLFRVHYFTNSLETWIYEVDASDSIIATVYNEEIGDLNNLPGRFAFYNAAQPDVHYSNFNYRWLPKFTISEDTICQGDATTFNFAIPNTLLPTIVDSMYWEFGDGTFQNAIIGDSIPVVNHTYQNFGRFPVKLWVIDQAGCAEHAFTDTVWVNFLPIVDLGEDTLLCPNQVFPLSTGYPEPAISTWQDTSLTTNWIINRPGLYYTEVDLYGCLGFDSIQVTYSDTISYTYSTDNSCFESSNGTAEVGNLGGVFPLSVQLEQEELDSVFYPPFEDMPPGDYLLSITDNNGCEINDMVYIGEGCMPSYELLIDSVSCFGLTNGRIEILQEACPLEISFAGIPLADFDTIGNLAVGGYLLEVTDLLGCNWDTLITISGPPPLEITNIRDTSVFLGECVPFFAKPSQGIADSVRWSPYTYLDIDYGSKVTATPILPIAYTIAMWTTKGCYAETVVNIDVTAKETLYLPTAFSPNGDGFNEYFYPYAGRLAKGVKCIKKLTIWDPDTHSLVFENYNFQPDDPSAAWDGTNDFEPMKPNVYLYIMEWEREDGEVFPQVGEVNLIR